MNQQPTSTRRRKTLFHNVPRPMVVVFRSDSQKKTQRGRPNNSKAEEVFQRKELRAVEPLSNTTSGSIIALVDADGEAIRRDGNKRKFCQDPIVRSALESNKHIRSRNPFSETFKIQISPQPSDSLDPFANFPVRMTSEMYRLTQHC